MKYIRSILVYLWIAAVLVVGLPYRWYCNNLKKTNEEKAYIKLHKVAQLLAKGILFFGGIKLRVHGQENVPKEGNVLFVGNHQSMIDIVTALAVVEQPLGFVAKDSLAKFWILRTWIAAVGSVFIARGESRKALQAVIESAKIVKSGHRMMVYPEGTRTRSGELNEFKPGSLKIAVRGDAAIVPVAVDGNFKALPASTIWVQKATVDLTFLPAISAEEVKTTDTTIMAENIKAAIADCLQK